MLEAFGRIAQRAIEELIQQPEQFDLTIEFHRTAQKALLLQKLPDVLLGEHQGPAIVARGNSLAGAAGGLYGVVSQINPYIGGALTAKSFAISIIGGLDNVLGVVAGGLFLGVVESLTALYLGPTYTDVMSLGILVLVLAVRPTGLLGRTA